MNILLIYPIDREFMPPSVFPLGVAYIASTLIENGHNVDILDMNAERDEGDSKLKKYLASNSYDWIGISSIITQYKKVKQLAADIKKLAPKTPLIMGGSGPTSHPIIFIKKALADIIVVGEGELTILDLCNHIDNRDVLINCPGLCLKHNNSILFTPSRQPIHDLDKIPFPVWENFPIQPYLKNCLFRFREDGKGINLMTSRGCPGKCTYCMRNFGNKVRNRSVKNIMDEIKILRHKFGVNHFHFIDDTIASDKKRLMNLAERIIETKIPITWSANARVTQVKPNLLEKMAKSGCVRLSYGVESADTRILKEMKKGITPKIASDAIQWTRQAGIDARAYFMIGFPSEDAASIQNSVEFCKENLVGGEFFFLTPFPGSEVYDYALQNGLITNEDVYLQVAGEVRNFVVNCTKHLGNETLFTIKEQAEKEIRDYLKKHGIEVKESIRKDPRESVKNLPRF